MRHDYAKEIAARALTFRGSDGDLLEWLAGYCIDQLGYARNSSELLTFVEGQRAKVLKWDEAA